MTGNVESLTSTVLVTVSELLLLLSVTVYVNVYSPIVLISTVPVTTTSAEVNDDEES